MMKWLLLLLLTGRATETTRLDFESSVELRRPMSPILVASPDEEPLKLFIASLMSGQGPVAICMHADRTIALTCHRPFSSLYSGQAYSGIAERQLRHERRLVAARF